MNVLPRPFSNLSYALPEKSITGEGDGFWGFLRTARRLAEDVSTVNIWRGRCFLFDVYGTPFVCPFYLRNEAGHIRGSPNGGKKQSKGKSRISFVWWSWRQTARANYICGFGYFLETGPN